MLEFCKKLVFIFVIGFITAATSYAADSTSSGGVYTGGNGPGGSYAPTGGNGPGGPGATSTSGGGFAGGGGGGAPTSIERILLQILALTKIVSTNVSSILVAVNNLPNYILNLTASDTTKTTASLQQNFTQLGNFLLTSSDDKVKSALMRNLNINLVTGNVNNPNPNALPTNSNDLVYTSLLNEPLLATDPRNVKGQPPVNYQYNYLKNASGISLVHETPTGNWQGAIQAQITYQNYYNTVVAAESFSAYILSQQYLEANQFNVIQRNLISQASDPKAWFAQVASENLGVVFRQMLMYVSQIFILLTQLTQSQRQMVTAQAMTNTLLIANNITNEGILSSKAQGIRPS